MYAMLFSQGSMLQAIERYMKQAIVDKINSVASAALTSSLVSSTQYQIDGLVQDCSISSALALEILQFYTKPSKWSLIYFISLWFLWSTHDRCPIAHLSDGASFVSSKLMPHSSCEGWGIHWEFKVWQTHVLTWWSFCHDLNQCWLFLNKVMWHSPDNKITGNNQDTIHWNVFDNYKFKITATDHKDN